MRHRFKQPSAPLFASALTVGVLGLAGCQGAIGSDGSGPPGTGAGSTSGVGGTGTGAGAGVGTAGAAGGPVILPGELSAPYTRLTRAEYQATVQAAFNVTATVSGTPADQRIGPFTSNANAPDPAHEFLLASEDLAAEIVPSVLPVCSGAAAASCISTSYQGPLERLYRRPLAPAEITSLAGIVSSLEGAGVSAEGATRGMLLSALMSADFLFRASPLSGQAARGRQLVEHLSYALVDAPPSPALLAASEVAPASLPAVLEAQALQLGSDERAVPVLARFLAQWLFVDVDSKLQDSAEFAATPLYAELLALAKNAMATNVSVKSFVNGTQGFIHEQNFAAYGMAPPTGAGDVLAVTWSGSRRGLISQELFLDATRHPKPTYRPIFRGHVIRTSFLCQQIASPPPGVVELDAEVMDRTVDPRCAGCHTLMDPIGKAFAAMDLDNQAPVPEAVVTGSGEVSGTYADVPALLDAIANSQTYADCFARNLLGFFLEQDPVDVDAPSVQDISAIVKAGGGFAEALAQVAVSLDERSRTATPWCTGE